MMKKLPLNRRLNRRQILIFASSSIVAAPFISLANETYGHIHVVKDPQCGCCSAWIKILESAGFNVTTESRAGSLLTAFKIENGIPRNMMSCHTAKIKGYFVEGHVPVREIKRLIIDRPDALGLSVPGMPYGSPGMGPAEGREAYDVFAIWKNGNVAVFQHYPKAGISV
ncbi:MAG: hypothetical protein ACI9O0_000535 [Paracoccaceae bacterium]|jgi:hypothetical protein